MNWNLVSNLRPFSETRPLPTTPKEQELQGIFRFFAGTRKKPDQPMAKPQRILDLLDQEKPGTSVTAKGWVRTKRESKNVRFINLNDGSSTRSIQCVTDPNSVDEALWNRITPGAALSIEGDLVESKGSEQRVELEVAQIEIMGEADPESYPIQPKKHSMEFLRENAHLRFRTRIFGAVFRIRHGLTYAIHRFFNERGFFNLHTPIITASDAEGAGEMFHVSSLPVEDPNKLAKDETGRTDFSQDLFGRQTQLTVSGQLEAELGAMGLSRVYTFGPTFRAENSNTSRHAAEFWMVEPEMAFFDLQDDVDLAEEFLQHIVQELLEKYPEDLEFLRQREEEAENELKKEEKHEKDLIERLKEVAEKPFERITYSDAVERLQKSKPYKKGRFEYPVEWGVDLQSEHERHLVKKSGRPVVITDYPKDIKAFYMRGNADGKTVGAMDVLFPDIGEIVGGSQREEREEILKERMQEFGIPEESMWWYLDIRAFGSVPHSGFGLGFERMLMFLTGMNNIRDVIPFPRTPGNAEF